MSVATATAGLRAGSWAPGGAAAFGTPFSAPGGQVAHIVSWALEYVWPLQQWLDQLVGDEDRVAAFATTWRDASADLVGVGDDLRASDARLDELEGRTARALRKRYDEIRALALDTAEWTEATATAVELASSIVTAVHDAIVGALSELAAIIADLFGFTFNPFDKVGQLRDLVDHAARFIRVIEQLIERMLDAFGRLLALLDALRPLIDEALVELRALLGRLIQAYAPVIGGVGGALIGTAVGGPLGVVLGAGIPGLGPLGGGLLGALGGGGVGGLLGTEVGLLLGGAAQDLLATDRRVTELDPGVLTGDAANAYGFASATDELASLRDLVQQNEYTDGMGGQDRSVVDIKKVVDARGEAHWVVSLPSTQDWNSLRAMFGDEFADTLKDYPPTNDLDSNIALMLNRNPALATQYERAVLQAMADAGVDGPVVYTGFSQGGIMAANLAADPDSPYEVRGIVTNGSPIETFDIPQSVRVVAFQHESDVVPLLDNGASSPVGTVVNGNHTTVTLPDPPGANGDMQQIHNAGTYADSAGRVPLGGYDDFFGTVVEHQQYTWGE